MIERLFPLYLHDLSAFTDYYTVDADGRWAPDHLPTWLASPEATALLVLADDRPAGFALVALVIAITVMPRIPASDATPVSG